MARHGRRLSGLCAAAIAAALVFSALVEVPASAAPGALAVDLQLVSQRPWLGPSGHLGVTLRLDNAGNRDLQGFLLRVGVYDRVTSRSDLHLSFRGTPSVPASAFTRYFTSTRLRAGDSMNVRLDQSVTALPSLGVVSDGGVFPLTFYLYDATGSELLDSLTTSLIYYPQSPPAPLDLAVVVPIETVPAEGPDGVFRPDPSGNYPLEDAVGPSGWLSSMVGALSDAAAPSPPPTPPQKHRRRHPKNRPLRVALAPSPRLLGEISDLAQGYDRETGGKVVHVSTRAPTPRAAGALLKLITTLVRSSGVQTMLTPYGVPDLPSLDRNFGLAHVASQLQAGQDALRASVGARPSWLFPPGGRLDVPTLDDLRLAGSGAHAVVSSTALQQPSDPAAAGCPNSFATFACPVRVRSDSTSSTGLVTDPGLEHRLAAVARTGDDRLDLQRFLAETSMIQAETPGVFGRVVAVATPALWRPSPALAGFFFSTLARAPWLRTVTPEEALQQGSDVVTKHVVTAAAPLAREPAPSYFSAISAAQAQVEHYAATLSSAARPPQLLARLRRDVLVAQSRLWWSSPGLQALGGSYASVARAEATHELHKVSIGGVNEISMTSQRAQIPFVLSSRAHHPVTVDIKLLSPKLRFDRSRLNNVVVQHGTQQIAVQATAQASGIFPVEVIVQTADGYVLARKLIQIRSTNFNEIALGLTGGALAFLIAFYVWGVIKKRRQPEQEAAESTTTA